MIRTIRPQLKPPTWTSLAREGLIWKVSSDMTSMTGHTTVVWSRAMRSNSGSSQPVHPMGHCLVLLGTPQPHVFISSYYYLHNLNHYNICSQYLGSHTRTTTQSTIYTRLDIVPFTHDQTKYHLHTTRQGTIYTRLEKYHLHTSMPDSSVDSHYKHK